MSQDHVRKIQIVGSDLNVPIDIKNQSVVLDVDTMATESSIAVEIDTSTATSPQTILTPSTGKAIDTRGVYIFTDSSAGEIAVKFATSGYVIAKIYASQFRAATLPDVRFTGATDEALVAEWTGL